MRNSPHLRLKRKCGELVTVKSVKFHEVYEKKETMQMNILRLTRHEASAKQKAELARIFGKVKVTRVSETLPATPREAVTRFDELARGFDVVEVVLPVNLLESVLKFSRLGQKGRIIKAVTERQLTEDGGVEFSFDHYVKVIKVEVVTERL